MVKIKDINKKANLSLCGLRETLLGTPLYIYVKKIFFSLICCVEELICFLSAT